MTARNEWLYWHPAAQTPDGLMPGYYWVATSPAECREVEANGGRLSDRWDDYERQMQAENECYL